MDVGQSAAYTTCMTYEASLDQYADLPFTESPVWVLGKQYSALYDREEVKRDVLSRLWFTYRRGFTAIDSTGPTSDAGWGCMLRCGQMMLAHALILRHLGREWTWQPEQYHPRYHEVLRLFLDKKNCPFSIHQIACMGVSEGKAVGQWFGPNTVAQVLKKLVLYDDWSNISIHVAMDNTVIINDIYQLCGVKKRKTDSKGNSKKCKCRGSCTDSCREYLKSLNNGLDANTGDVSIEGANAKRTSSWKPLLLIIPLRLGLSEINSVYIESLQQCLTLPQSVGIIGGKPNHAHWFIGFVDNQLIYLDPHVTQQTVYFSSVDESDDSFHCEYISRMDIMELDPSIAVGFYCGTEASFDQLCQTIRKDIIQNKRSPMFELYKDRPPHWPPFEPYKPEGSTNVDFTMVERKFDSDEDFELI